MPVRECPLFVGTPEVVAERQPGAIDPLAYLAPA
jgi:hypothetical protein